MRQDKEALIKLLFFLELQYDKTLLSNKIVFYDDE